MTAGPAGPEPVGVTVRQGFDAREFWARAQDKQLVTHGCVNCQARFLPPRYRCPQCGSLDLQWIEADGAGVVVAKSVVHRGSNAYFRGIAPYVVALVRLNNGAQLLTNIVGDDRLTVASGDSVAVEWHADLEGQWMPMFRRVSTGADV